MTEHGLRHGMRRIAVQYLTSFFLSVVSTEVCAQLASPSQPTKLPPTRPTALDLTIELVDFPAVEIVKGLSVNFQSACQSFGKLLSGNRGLWGSGPFQNISCQAVLGGAEVKKKSSTPWRLSVSGDVQQKKFEIYLRSAGGQESLQAAYRVKTEVGPLGLMMSDETKSLIAFYLTQSLPFRSAIPANAMGAPAVKITGPSGPLQGANLARDMQVFGLTRVDDLWQAVPIQSAKMRPNGSGTYEWIVDKINPSSQLKLNEFYFLQQFKNRQEILQKTDELIRKRSSSFFEKYLNIGRSAYVGARYGFPIRAQGVLQKAPLIGIFGDFRSGILSGLKVNYDMIPKQRYSDDESDVEFNWSRFQLGYSFVKRLNNRILNSVDVTPRLGVTSLTYKLGLTSGDQAASDFNLSRSPTIGLEAAAESINNYFRLRLWAFASASMGVLLIDKNYASSSYRLGFDVYRQIFSFKTLKVAALGFSLYESTRISKNGSDDDFPEDGTLLRQVILNSSFLGGGVTLTW